MPQRPEDTGYDAQYQDLQNQLDVQRSARFKEVSRLCDPSDPVCTKCLTEYQQNPRARTKLGPSFSPTCKMSTTYQIAQAEKSEWWASLSDTEKANFKLMTDPVYWAEVRLRNHDDPDTPWRPRWYQVEALRCTSRRLLLRFGRQVGKTDLLCARALWRLDTRAGCKLILVCPFQAQASLIFSRLEAFINASPDLRARLKRKRENPVHEMEFDNGSYIRMFTAGVQTGKGGSDVRGQPADCFVAGTPVSTSEFATRPIERLTIDCPVLGGNGDGPRVGGIDALMARQVPETISVSTWLTASVCTPEHPLFDGNKDVPAKEAEEVIVSLAHQELSFSRRMIKARLAGYSFGDGWLESSGHNAGFAGQAADLEQVVEDLTLLGDTRHRITTYYKENPVLGIRGIVSEVHSAAAFDLLKDSCPVGHKTAQKLVVPAWIRNGHSYIKASFLSGLFSAESTPVGYQNDGRTVRAIPISMVSEREEWIRGWMEQVRDLFTDLGIRTSEVKTWPKRDSSKWYGGFRICNAKENIDAFVDKVGFCYNVERRISANTWRLYRRYEAVYEQEAWRKNRSVRRKDGSAAEVGRSIHVPKSTVKYHRHLYDPLYSEDKLTAQELVDRLRWKGCYVKLPIQDKRRVSMGPNTVYNLQTNADHRYFAGGMFTHNCLILDEMDLLDDKTVDAVFATLISAKDPEIWISSTPTGKKGHFYEWSTDPSHGFRSLHYPSMVSPTWSQETELLMRKTYSQAAFACEYLAEFGFMEAGVFRRQDLDAPGVIQDYDIENPAPKEDEVYGMGVDWNMKGTGGVILLLGYSKYTHKLRVAYREVVDPAEFTQLATVQRIERLNKIWKPKFIYVDKGYGSTQIELLERYGLENNDSGLAKKVRGVDMKGNLEIRDPLTKKMIKKQAKNLMIELAVSRVEALQCIFPKSEDYRRGLVGQMREYKIEYVGRGGSKIFTGENEHLLTAWALAILGFMMELGDIVRTQATHQVVMLDSNLQRFSELKAKAQKNKIPVRVPRTAPKAKLTVVESINFAKTGIPDPVKRRLQSQDMRPLGRNKWR